MRWEGLEKPAVNRSPGKRLAPEHVTGGENLVRQCAREGLIQKYGYCAPKIGYQCREIEQRFEVEFHT